MFVADPSRTGTRPSPIRHGEGGADTAAGGAGADTFVAGAGSSAAAAARDECVRLMQSNPTLDVISVLADNDVLVFIDADGGNAPDLAIRLSGVNLDAISYLNFT